VFHIPHHLPPHHPVHHVPPTHHVPPVHHVPPAVAFMVHTLATEGHRLETSKLVQAFGAMVIREMARAGEHSRIPEAEAGIAHLTQSVANGINVGEIHAKMVNLLVDGARQGDPASIALGNKLVADL
jgi:hypothetical protein